DRRGTTDADDTERRIADAVAGDGGADDTDAGDDRAERIVAGKAAAQVTHPDHDVSSARDIERSDDLKAGAGADGARVAAVRKVPEVGAGSRSSDSCQQRQG